MAVIGQELKGRPYKLIHQAFISGEKQQQQQKELGKLILACPHNGKLSCQQ
jgi:hypothetical protein